MPNWPRPPPGSLRTRTLPPSTKTRWEDPASRPPCWLWQPCCNMRRASPTKKPSPEPPTICAGAPFCARKPDNLCAPRAPSNSFAPISFCIPRCRAIFQASLKEAKRTGLLKGQALRIALDTKPIRGRGAVQDTFNLLATGIRQLGRALAQQAGQKPDAFLSDQGLDRYTHASLKGSADLDWCDEAAKAALLTQIVARCPTPACGWLLSDPKVREAAQLLEQLLLQDVRGHPKPTTGRSRRLLRKARPRGGCLRRPIPTCVTAERAPPSASTATRPMSRWTRTARSSSPSTSSQAMRAMPVGRLSLVEQAETNTGLAVEETTGDCAYGGGSHPAGVCRGGARLAGQGAPGGVAQRSVCQERLRHRCGQRPGDLSCRSDDDDVSSHSREGARRLCSARSVPIARFAASVRPPRRGEACRFTRRRRVLQSARAYQKTPEGKARLRKRVVVEHRLARLGQLGIGQARYFGRAKTRFQLMLASSLANFRWVWNQEARQGAVLGSEAPSSLGKREPYRLFWASSVVAVVFCAGYDASGDCATTVSLCRESGSVKPLFGCASRRTTRK